jgi:hypothetical protein
LILSRVIEDYSRAGYNYVEAYPRKKTVSCEKNYHGPLALYRHFGFFTETEYEDYLVVRKSL